MKTIRHSVALATIALMGATTLPMHSAMAQPSTVTAQAAMPRVTGFGVREIERVEPGSELDFTVWGTPGAQALLQIDGARRPLTLVETSAGHYEGTYTVGRSDRITPDSKVTVNLRRDNRVATALLSQPLQAGWPSPVAASKPPQIESVRVVEEPGQRRSRGQLRFTLMGTPGGQASVRLMGTHPRTLVLEEVRSGEYSALFPIAETQGLDVTQPLTASLRVGQRTTQTSFEGAYDGMSWQEQRADWCTDCGVVEAINRVEVDGDAPVLGTVAGGVLGGLAGSRIGKGDGRTLGGIAGAVGGALLGREIQKRTSQRTQYEVVVRTNDNQTRTVTFEDTPPVKVGDAVRLVGNTLELRRS